jgi:hypothetical protein
MSVQATNYAMRACNLKDDVARHVLTALAWRSKKETPHLVFMKNEDIREDTGLTSINGVKNAINRLVAAGEVRVIDVGGRLKKRGAMACDFELVGVRQWIEANEPERPEWRGPVAEEAKMSRGDDELSRHDGKVSCGDDKVSRDDEKLSRRDTHRPDSHEDSAEGAETTSPPIPAPRNAGKQPTSQPLPNHRSERVSGAERLPRGVAAKNATGAVKDAIRARCDELAALHPEDSDAWFEAMQAEFGDIDVVAVARKFREKTGGLVRSSLVFWFFTEDRTKLPKLSRRPRQMSEADKRTEDYYGRLERMMEKAQPDAYAQPATNITPFAIEPEPALAAAGA